MLTEKYTVPPVKLMGVVPSDSKKVRLIVLVSPLMQFAIVLPSFGIYLPINLDSEPPPWFHVLALAANTFFFFTDVLSPGLTLRSVAGILFPCLTPKSLWSEPTFEGLIRIGVYAIYPPYGDGLGDGDTDDEGDSEAEGLSEAEGDELTELDGDREAEGDELTELEGDIEADGDELSDEEGLSDLEADELGESEELALELGDCDGLPLAEVELDGLFELLGEVEGLVLADVLEDGLSDTLVLGESEALGEVEVLGDREALAEPLGEMEADGEREAEGLMEALGETDAEGLAEALGEIIEPATRATTEEPALLGFQIHTKRIRPDVIVPVETVMVISLVIARTGKLVTVSAIKVA